MTESIRGIECWLDSAKMGDFLHYIASGAFDFYVQACRKIDAAHRFLPGATGSFSISPQELKRIAREECVWELVLHLYPSGAAKQAIETYADFMHSVCACCLILYDCSALEIYVKDPDFRQRLWDALSSLGAEAVELKTDASDGRTGLTL